MPLFIEESDWRQLGPLKRDALVRGTWQVIVTFRFWTTCLALIVYTILGSTGCCPSVTKLFETTYTTYQLLAGCLWMGLVYGAMVFGLFRIMQRDLAIASRVLLYNYPDLMRCLLALGVRVLCSFVAGSVYDVAARYTPLFLRPGDLSSWPGSVLSWVSLLSSAFASASLCYALYRTLGYMCAELIFWSCEPSPALMVRTGNSRRTSA